MRAAAKGLSDLIEVGKEPEAEAEDNHVLTMMAVVAIVVIDDDSDDHEDENTMRTV